MAQKRITLILGTFVGVFCTFMIVSLLETRLTSVSSSEWIFWVVWGISIGIVNSLSVRWIEHPLERIINQTIVVLGMVIFWSCVGGVIGVIWVSRIAADWKSLAAATGLIVGGAGGVLIGGIIGLALILRKETISEWIERGTRRTAFGTIIGFVFSLLYMVFITATNYESVVTGFDLLKGIISSAITGVIIAIFVKTSTFR